MKKLSVAVLMGGGSAEHEISVVSGQQVIKKLNKKKFKITPVLISKNNIWSTSINTLKKKKVDVVFIAMHGTFAEDGAIQGLLELNGFKYTGSGILASALGMDKLAFRKIIERLSLFVPKYVALGNKDSLNMAYKVLGSPPYFVKPNKQGSSVGASIAKTKKDLRAAVKKAFRYDDTVLIDEYIEGIELTCAVLGNENPKALPLVEIVPKKGEFFDYNSKYTESGSDEIVPARISKTIANKVQNIAIKIYKEMGCRGFGRVDFILKNEKPYVLEINTIPGLTPMSLFPKAAMAAGITYTNLLDKVIRLAL